MPDLESLLKELEKIDLKAVFDSIHYREFSVEDMESLKEYFKRNDMNAPVAAGWITKKDKQFAQVTTSTGTIFLHYQDGIWTPAKLEK